MARTGTTLDHAHGYDDAGLPDHLPLIGERDAANSGAARSFFTFDRTSLDSAPEADLHDHDLGTIWKNPVTGKLEGTTGPGGKDGHLHPAGTLGGGDDFF